MSDVAESLSDDREVTGFVELEVLDVPDVPTTPVPGRTVRSEEVALSWRAPEGNGAPIEVDQVRDDRGETTRCGSTSCDIGGLTNGEQYRFQVRAANAVGESDWSDLSVPATPDAKPGVVGPIDMVERGDGFVRLRWSAPTTETSAIENYWVTWPGGPSGGQSTRTTEIVAKGLDNNTAQAFTVVAENGLGYGERRVSGRFQSIGPPGTPPAPSVTDQQTGDGETAVTVAWAAVGANGPSPVVYTVLRNGQPLAQCTNIPRTSCDDSGLTYDGAKYRYAVRATNNDAADDAKDSPVGQATEWSAVGQPAAWDDAWTVTPTGANTMARVSFTVPPSRGAASQVSILVDGVVRDSGSWTGAQTREVTVGDNDRAHTVSLQVCNEAGRCSPSGAKSVQTYGPFVAGHIISMEPHTQESGTDSYEVWWTITVDNNGDPATVRVTSRVRDRQRDPGRDAGDDLGRRADLHHQQAGHPRRHVRHPARDAVRRLPRRTGVQREDRITTQERPQPRATIARGTRCSDVAGSGLPACNTDGSGTNCLVSSCGRIRVTSANYTDNQIRCEFWDNVDGQFSVRWVDSNRDFEPGTYYGYPGRQVWAVCNGVDSPRYTWPP